MTKLLKAQQQQLIEPLSSGLTVVAVRDESLMDITRSTFEQVLLTQSSNLGLPMPKLKELHCMLSGSKRALSVAKAMANSELSLKHKAKKTFDEWGSREGFQWCSDEGMCVLENSIQDSTNKWLTFEQRIENPITAQTSLSLERIHNLAVDADACVMAFLKTKESFTDSRLHDYFEYFEVNSCDPEPEYLWAMHINCVSLQSYHGFQLGNVMCNIKLKDSKYFRQWRPFVSTELRDRVMWMMRSQGNSLTEIGLHLKLNKSNVKRRLDKLTPPIKQSYPDDWLKKYDELLEVTSAEPIQSKPPFGIDEEEEDEDE